MWSEFSDRESSRLPVSSSSQFFLFTMAALARLQCTSMLALWTGADPSFHALVLGAAVVSGSWNSLIRIFLIHRTPSDAWKLIWGRPFISFTGKPSWTAHESHVHPRSERSILSPPPEAFNEGRSPLTFLGSYFSSSRTWRLTPVPRPIKVKGGKLTAPCFRLCFHLLQSCEDEVASHNCIDEQDWN